MKSTNKKGFTLVELIIVITILAILATIAFVSFQSYTKDARNSKRMSDIASIAQAIEVKLANSVNVLDLVTGANTRTKSGAGDHLAWFTATTAATASKYKANSSINFNVVGAKAEDFTDPKGGAAYLIGATSLAGGAYEVATEWYETDAGTGAKIDGNFKPRTMSNSGVVSTATTLTNGQQSFTLSGSNGLGMFKYGDILSNGWEIIGVSNDLTRITLSGWTQLATSNSVYLSGLLAATGSGEIKSLISGLTGY